MTVPSIITDDAPELVGTHPTSPREAIRTAGRALLTTIAFVWVYFLVPVDRAPSVSVALFLAAGLAAMVVMLAWQVRSITAADNPRLRAIQVLGTALPLLIVLFALTYLFLIRSDADAFSQPLTKIDALYFTVTTFATVGFGDIAARSQPARALVTFQMFTDLVFIGLGVRVLLGAVQVGLARKAPQEPAAPAQRSSSLPDEASKR